MDTVIAQETPPENVWTTEVPTERLLDVFSGFDRGLLDLIRAGTVPVRANPVYERDPIDTWSIGNVTLLGDAAHPMAPRMGQGANMAIQDAGALATSLRDAVVRERPDRFGLFATLTLPDVDGAIAEAHYAFDHLQADGVVLLANVGGRYLGDPAFDRLFAMLDEREAVVFVHPSDLPGPAIDGAPPYAADFLLDTTRAAITLVTSGTLTRYPKLRIILSHGGGFLPYAAYRIATLFHDSSPETGLALLRRFYFDVALSSSPAALPSLCAFADPSHITFGSDSPYAPDAIASWMGGMADAYPFASDVRYAIDRGNAEMLFPRLKLS